jgi:hypothetical protein
MTAQIVRLDRVVRHDEPWGCPSFWAVRFKTRAHVEGSALYYDEWVGIVYDEAGGITVINLDDLARAYPSEKRTELNAELRAHVAVAETDEDYQKGLRS